MLFYVLELPPGGGIVMGRIVLLMTTIGLVVAFAAGIALAAGAGDQGSRGYQDLS